MRPRNELIDLHNLKQSVRRLTSTWWWYWYFVLKIFRLVLVIGHAALLGSRHFAGQIIKGPFGSRSKDHGPIALPALKVEALHEGLRGSCNL